MRFLGAYRYHRLYEISADLREIGAENGNHFVRNYVVVFEPQMDTAEQKTFAKEWGVFENVSAARRAIDAKCEEMRQRNLTQIENAAHMAAEEKRKMCALRAGEKNKNGTQRE